MILDFFIVLRERIDMNYLIKILTKPDWLFRVSLDVDSVQHLRWLLGNIFVCIRWTWLCFLVARIRQLCRRLVDNGRRFHVYCLLLSGRMVGFGNSLWERSSPLKVYVDLWNVFVMSFFNFRFYLKSTIFFIE